MCVCARQRATDGEEGAASYMHASVCVCCEGLNESQRAHMGHRKQTMKNESGEAEQLVLLWEQPQAGVRTFSDNRFVRVCVCVQN